MGITSASSRVFISADRGWDRCRLLSPYRRPAEEFSPNNSWDLRHCIEHQFANWQKCLIFRRKWNKRRETCGNTDKYGLCVLGLCVTSPRCLSRTRKRCDWGLIWSEIDIEEPWIWMIFHLQNKSFSHLLIWGHKAYLSQSKEPSGIQVM